MTPALSFTLSAAALMVLLIALCSLRRMDPIRVPIIVPLRNHQLRAKRGTELIELSSPPQKTREEGQR